MRPSGVPSTRLTPSAVLVTETSFVLAGASVTYAAGRLIGAVKTMSIGAVDANTIVLILTGGTFRLA